MGPVRTGPVANTEKLQLTYECGKGPAEESGHGREEDGQLQVSVEPGTVAEQGLGGDSTDLFDYLLTWIIT